MTPVWFNVRKAAQVAAFFVWAQGGKIHVLKLLQLIYLADRQALESHDAPILNDKFVSMAHGPANSLTMNQINGCADKNEAWDQIITDRHGHFVALRNRNLAVSDFDELSNAEIEILELTWQRFGGMGQTELRDHNRRNCPEWEDPDGASEPIPLERIFKFLGKPNGAALATKLESERIMDMMFARADALPSDEEGDSAHALGAAG
jgi:uncharacterized phage-associated protein